METGPYEIGNKVAKLTGPYVRMLSPAILTSSLGVYVSSCFNKAVMVVTMNWMTKRLKMMLISKRFHLPFLG